MVTSTSDGKILLDRLYHTLNIFDAKFFITIFQHVKPHIFATFFPSNFLYMDSTEMGL
jgi:hypothetical protein